MKVLLYRVGRNLNRAYRTCEAFGVKRIQLLDCDVQLSGNLFKASGRVSVEVLQAWPPPAGLLAFETRYRSPIAKVVWPLVETIVIGGETFGLPAHLKSEQSAYIPMVGQVSGLTVEAALAIALYEWRNHV